jgi:hypothetical protein
MSIIGLPKKKISFLSLLSLSLFIALTGCAGGPYPYQAGGDHSLATASQTMGPRNHASASIGQPLPPNGW